MSDTAKHTPGKWTTSPCSNGGAILHRGGEDAWKHPQGMLQIVPAEDAYLIAVAPELLRCAEILAGLEDEWGGRTFPTKQDCQFARAIISRATGEGK